MKKKKVLNKKTGALLFVLLILAVIANFYSRHRDAREAEDMKTKESVSADTNRLSYKIKMEDFSIGEHMTVEKFVRYSDGSSMTNDSGTEAVLPAAGDIVFDKETAKAAADQLSRAMQEIGMAVFTGSDFAVAAQYYAADEASLDIAAARYEKAVEKYAYQDGSGIICVDFSNVTAEVTDETEDGEVPKVKIRLEYNCHITSDKMDMNTLSSVEEDKSGGRVAEFQWEDGRWKLFYSGEAL